jgi:hypothetical protein
MQLRDYQMSISNAASNLLKQYKIAYLSMQVRTGKTITALNTAKIYGAKNVLFVTKLKAIPGIAKDAAHFDFNTYIINFESLHKVTDTFDLVIIDEAHSLGQYPTMSERTKLLSKICQVKPIIYLSGTPSPESYSQLFHQFKVSTFTPFIEKNFYEWAKTYVHVSKKYIYNRAINDYSMADEMAIRDKVQHLFISYTQEEAGFTQLVNEHIHKVRMNDTTYNIIRLLKRDKVVTGKHGHVIEGDTAVKLMNKLHQLYSGTVIYDDSPMDNDGQIFDMSKAEYIFKTFAGLKVAIFYKFVAEKLLLETAAAMNGLKVTTDPAEFNRTPNDVIFISQFLSGREGINLSAADCLVCYNIDFSAVTYWQVRARLQTKDRTTPADVHWIMADQGIESHIYSQVSDKKNYTLSYFKTNYK